MRKIIDYKIVELRFDDAFRRSGISAGQDVRDAIIENWVPIGGICILPNTGLILQAMIKYENNLNGDDKWNLI